MSGSVTSEALNTDMMANSHCSNISGSLNKFLSEDSHSSGGSDLMVDGLNFNHSSSSTGGHSGGPITTSTPIADRSFEIQELEQPTSSTENCNYGAPLPKYGTLIPNRVFVGGISCHTTEPELMQLFSKFGSVRGTKIIMDRTGISKGYGFVTFETEDEAKRLFNAVNNRELPPIVLRDRRLNIAPAVKKQQPLLRQNATYGSQGSTGSCSTFSPPPYEPFYYGGQPPQAEYFVPPVPIQDNFFGQSNGYATTPSTGPFYSTLPPFAMGQGIPTPNGGSKTEYFVPPVPAGTMQDSFFQQSNGFTTTPQSTGPFYTSIPNLGVGQAIPGPNGSTIFWLDPGFWGR